MFWWVWIPSSGRYNIILMIRRLLVLYLRLTPLWTLKHMIVFCLQTVYIWWLMLFYLNLLTFLRLRSRRRFDYRHVWYMILIVFRLKCLFCCMCKTWSFVISRISKSLKVPRVNRSVHDGWFIIYFSHYKNDYNN